MEFPQRTRQTQSEGRRIEPTKWDYEVVVNQAAAFGGDRCITKPDDAEILHAGQSCFFLFF